MNHQSETLTGDRARLIERIKLDPSAYVAERITFLDKDDIKRLMQSLAGTYGIEDEIRCTGKEIKNA